jgi:hypothetical protein
MEEAPHAPRVGAGAAPPPKPTTPALGQPAARTAFQTHWARLVSNMGHRSPHPFGRGRCPFSPLLRPYSPGGAVRGSHTGQFSCFGPRSCFIAHVLDIPNGVWPLNRAVWRAYIRETVPALEVVGLVDVLVLGYPGHPHAARRTSSLLAKIT